MSTQHRRDGSIVFEEPATDRAGNSAAPMRLATTGVQAKRSHDSGAALTYGDNAPAVPPPANTVARPQAVPVTAPSRPEPIPITITTRASEKPVHEVVRSHDPGVTLETVVPPKPPEKKEEPATVGSFLFSLIELGGATARFAFDQIQTGFRIIKSPSRALDIIERSIQSYAKALESSVDEVRKGTEGHK